MSTTAQAVGFSFVEQLAQDLRDERLELPAFPEAVLRIQRALQSPDTSTDDVVRILSSEPALAARLLRIANSVEFRRMDQDITDLRKAVSRMGLRARAVVHHHAVEGRRGHFRSRDAQRRRRMARDIGKAILESWGLPEALQNAVEQQDQFEIELDGAVTLTDILIAAKLLTRGEQDAGKYPAVRRVGLEASERALGLTEEYAEELQGVRNSLSE